MSFCLFFPSQDSADIVSGSNWIPAHNFLTALTADDYRAWLTLLRDGNQNMVRLWGGGVYEPDVFYDICDGTCAQLERHVVGMSWANVGLLLFR